MLISNNINRYNINTSYKPAPVSRVSVSAPAMDTVSFRGSDPNTVENKMKRISGLHDPYSEIIMVSDDEFEKYMKKVEKRPTAQSMVNLLHGYEKNLFKPEKEVCEILSATLNDYKRVDPQKASTMDLHDLLNACYLSSEISLKQTQLNVLDDINNIISDTNGNTKQILGKIFEPVEESIRDNSFRISPLLSQVRKTKGIDRSVKKAILSEMDNFPNSRNNADVFIITNAHKTHEEIAEAFITPSRVSIEHIKPESCRGASNVSNYLIASKRMNSIRSSMPLDKFIKRHPQIPNYMEQYFNDLVKKINQGGLTYLAMSLPDITQTIERESKGIVQLEIGGICPNETSKVNLFKEQLEDLIRKFSK